MIKAKKAISKEERKLLRKATWRTFTLSSSYNFEKAQGLGFLYSMLPFINKYNKSDEKRKAAYKRHYTTFNTTPTFGSYITGICCKMEKEAAESEDYPYEQIETSKAMLMAPVASIGDSLLWGMLRIISLAVGLSFAINGSVLGAIVHLLLFNIPLIFIRHSAAYVGYSEGTGFLTKLYNNNIIEYINKAMTALTLIMLGSLTCEVINIPIVSSFSFEGGIYTIESFASMILPCLLPLLLVFLFFGIVKTKINSNLLIGIVLVLSLAGAFFGLY